MPTAKGKGPSTSQRYRPASGYDDATLAQKREYWRTKKREQRARLSQRRGKPHDAGGLQLLSAPAPLTSTSSGPFKLPLTDFPAPQSGSAVQDSALGSAESRKEKWFQTMKLNKVLPHIAATCSITARAASDAAATDCLKAKGRVTRAVTSATSSGTQQDTSSSVPPVKVTRYTNGSAAKATPTPYVSMQGPSDPRTQHKAPVALHVQPKLPPTNARLLVSSPCDPVPVKALNTTPQSRTTRALVTAQRAKGDAQALPESEEERAAKRREQWRLKKREQRAKLAARAARAREKVQCVDASGQRRQAADAGLHLRKQGAARLKALFTSAKGENVRGQSRGAGLAAGNLQAQGNRTAQAAIPCDSTSGRKTGELHRKLPSYVHLSVSRGVARCKTPRQRLIESQKNLMSQRNIRCKSLLVSSVFGSRNLHRVDPGDSPEQVVAKRREYWRIKKREQRAKLSMEVKARLKEKDSLMRRVKRYQRILEEMRKARAPPHSAGGLLSHASEGIGGFIKEDGTVTANAPQGPTGGNAAVPNSMEEPRKSTPAAQPQRPPNAQPAQVSGQAEDKPPRLRAHSESTNASNPAPLTIQCAAQLTLTHPKTPLLARPQGRSAGSDAGGCVMKMAVSSAAPSLSPLVPDSGLTEDERMAKKREYWRMKKREQRAARAARLKQGAALQRRKAQKQLSRGLGGRARAPSRTEPDIKQERESMPAVDLNSQPQQAFCPDIKPPTSPPAPPPVPPQESDTALSADSQAATLLAVASMKKLLEESLSTVTEHKAVQTDVKKEATEQDMKPDVAQLFPVKDEVSPLDDLTLQTNWQPDTDALVANSSQSPHLKDLSHPSRTLSPPKTSSEKVPLAACEHFSQARDPSPPRRTRPLPTQKPSLHSCCAPEPPKLHHLPMDQQHQLQGQCQSSRSPPARVLSCATVELSGLTSIQRKREYWKLMKRQQRARLKARQGGASLRSMQAPAKLSLRPRPSIASVATIPNISTVLVTSPTTCNGQQCPTDTLQLINSVSCSLRSEQSHMNTGPSPISPNCLGPRQGQQHVGPGCPKWTSKSTDIDPGPSLPTLKPPDNPLACINLQPIELPDQPSDSSLGPLRIPCVKFQSPTCVIDPPTKLPPISTMVPPKPVPGESEEEFLKRKREYWRIKKKEQRARKAFRDKGIPPRRSSENWRPILPTQNLQTQDSGQWGSCAESDNLLRNSQDSIPGLFPCSNYTAPLEDGSVVLFPDFESNDGEEGSVSDAVWRNRYLMDYDPLNQLLVCMVCGDLQYSHSLEGVRAHIDEAHPETLNLETGERLRILEAWDEQVSQRERFFTSQLQQHSGPLAEAHRN
ncbi:uncharacterized protein si:dkey-28a3.2 [Betta splendens]|uniref:Uncharacterized protein si:dkey-28a3.2 n=1 Tax=Betta splendens TaxID=158456 RepID=A0A6P7L4J1_BETSP|nr:uncharacterized protein si:dkey-28a3.2 [Betta splendens]XP_028988863.1 uncharacterized protein si:dkey-28a3.2 [Betta splendens]XP_028988870.1 uncharacterized protein si:dkey-28a3.2 [Betta splendens]XP_028988880.1 uncharacterized protein si:dkey-28a3.2 [Betta splendens]